MQGSRFTLKKQYDRNGIPFGEPITVSGSVLQSGISVALSGTYVTTGNANSAIGPQGVGQGGSHFEARFVANLPEPDHGNGLAPFWHALCGSSFDKANNLPRGTCH